MTPNQATLDFLRGKTSAPSELRTAEWSRVPAEIRERAFFMAAVEDVEILDRFRAEVEAIARGDKSESEAMAEMGDYLTARGYRPLPGQEGTIKDLSTLARQRVALRTNVEAARSYGQWVRQQQALAAFPATRYVRGREAMVPRDWPARWQAALAVVGLEGATPGDSEDDMIALANHPVWSDENFNRLGSPWPPFDFGSGMTTMPVSRREAERLGLLPEDDDDSAEAAHLRDMLTPQDRSFNETLEARPAVASQPLRDLLAERLRGFAKWDGEVLRFTDPNGTRPGSVEEIANRVTAPLPLDPATGRPFPSLQADAADEFILDPEEFARLPDRNRWTDFARLLGRAPEVFPPSRRDAILNLLASDRGTDTEPPTWLEKLVGLPAWPEILQITSARARLIAMLRAVAAAF